MDIVRQLNTNYNHLCKGIVKTDRSLIVLQKK